MQKQYLSILVAAAALSLTACGDDSTTAPTVDSQTAVPGDVLGNVPSEIPEGVVSGDSLQSAQPGETQLPVQSVDDQQTVLPGETTPETPVPGESSVVPGETVASSSSAVVPGQAVTSSSSIQGQVNPASSSSSVVIVPSSDEDDSDDDSPVASEAGDVLLALNGTSATVTNDNGCVTVADKKITVACSGNYYLSGTATDLQVLVNTPNTDQGNVGLYLNNASIKSSDAPIFVKNAEKTVLHLVAGTQNTLEDGSTRTGYTKDDGTLDTTNAAVYAKDDLNIKGSGKLTVKANYNNGIQSSNDIKVKNGEIIVTAKNNGVKGKGSVVISGGSLNITASGDGIKSDECVEDASGNCTSITEGKGFVEITGGTVTVTSTTDGISAENYVSIANGEAAPTVKIVAGGGQTCLGSSSSSSNTGYTGGRPGGMGGMGGGSASCLSDSDPSSKGIKADRILISGGVVNVESHDDGIHADGSVYISGGMVTVKTDDDGVHAEDTLRVTDGTVAVNMAYEGFEGYVIDLQGGVTSVITTDDGWNAAGGSSSSTGNAGGWGGMGGFGGMGGGSSGFLYVSGGFHYVKVGTGDTDGVDSNGSISISGGVIVVECMMNGGMGGILDSDGTTTITGGTVLGFGSKSSEKGTNYSVSFNTSSYYGGSNIAYKPTFSGSIMVTNFGTPAAVSSVSGMQKQCFAGGTDICVYYK